MRNEFLKTIQQKLTFKANLCDIKEIVEAYYMALLDEVLSGNSVFIPDFGKFSIVEKASQRYMNIHTKEIQVREPVKRLRFAINSKLRKRIKEG